MAMSSLFHPYVLNDEAVQQLLDMEAEGNPLFDDPSFVSRLATPERLEELNAIAGANWRRRKAEVVRP